MAEMAPLALTMCLLVAAVFVPRAGALMPPGTDCIMNFQCTSENCRGTYCCAKRSCTATKCSAHGDCGLAGGEYCSKNTDCVSSHCKGSKCVAKVLSGGDDNVEDPKNELLPICPGTPEFNLVQQRTGAKEIADFGWYVKVDKLRRLVHSEMERRFTSRRKKLHERTAPEFLKFHGTTQDRAHQIINYGFQLPPEYPKNNMFGQGIYFATDAVKSTAYTSPDGGSKFTLVLAAVWLGKHKQQNGADVSLTPTKVLVTHDSVWAPKGMKYKTNNGIQKSLIREEFVIYNEDQAFPRYVMQWVNKTSKRERRVADPRRYSALQSQCPILEIAPNRPEFLFERNRSVVFSFNLSLCGADFSPEKPSQLTLRFEGCSAVPHIVEFTVPVDQGGITNGTTTTPTPASTAAPYNVSVEHVFRVPDGVVSVLYTLRAVRLAAVSDSLSEASASNTTNIIVTGVRNKSFSAIPRVAAAYRDCILSVNATQCIEQMWHRCRDGKCTPPYEDVDSCPEDCTSPEVLKEEENKTNLVAIVVPSVVVIVLSIAAVGAVVVVHFKKAKRVDKYREDQQPAGDQTTVDEVAPTLAQPPAPGDGSPPVDPDPSQGHDDVE